LLLLLFLLHLLLNLLLFLLLHHLLLLPVLQAEVSPPLLIKQRRKFHIRSYLAILEKLDHPDLMDLYIFHRHEVRIAGRPIPEGSTERHRLSHITNGALSTETERVLLTEVDELADRQLTEMTEAFIAEAFGKHLLPDIVRRISVSAQEPETNPLIRKFAVAGLDIMVTQDNRIYLLEVNANPASPPLATLSAAFQEHVQGFFHELIDLVLGRPAPNFISAPEILARDNLLL
jgi:Tubulin-tyrosine ligase family